MSPINILTPRLVWFLLDLAKDQSARVYDVLRMLSIAQCKVIMAEAVALETNVNVSIASIVTLKHLIARRSDV